MTGETPHDTFAKGLVGTRVAGRYIVEKVLGKGGMGCVTAATYPELEQRVAIKFMWPELCENVSLATRFVREARLAAKITSPHLVRVFDVGRLDNGTPYLVMERLDGNDLAEEVDKRGRLPIAEVASHLLQTLQGLAEIHSRAIVHRDLKPPNLFLANEGGARIVKVLDFGISKENQAGKPLTALTTESILGTPHYMAPEQVRDSRDVDARSDIWSMGVILYELLTGTLPFSVDATSFGEVFGRILFTNATPPRELRPDLPASLDAVVMKCLQRERDDRYGDVGALARDLAPFAPAVEQHRAEAVVRVLTAKHTPTELGSDPQLVLRPTIPDRPASKRATPEAPAESPVASAPRPLASSTQSAWDARPKPTTGRRAVTLIVAVGAIAIGVVVFVMTRQKPREEPPPAPAATAATATELPTTAIPPPVETAAAVSTAIVVPSASAPPPKKPVVGARPPVVAAPPPPSVTVSPKPPDLVYDRK